jgi:tetratricopeptide (TPR) repeat protein
MDEGSATFSWSSLARAGYWPTVAQEHFRRGEYSKAVDLCLRMLDLEPNVISGRVVLARSFFHAGQYQQARDQFIQVLKADAANLVALKYLGDILYRGGEAAAAMAYYRRIWEIDPCCQGLSSSLERKETTETRQMTIRRGGENLESRVTSPLREPAFITETVGDIYREQGYFQLAREVYRRLLKRQENARIVDKLRDIEEKLSKKDNLHETSDR